MCHKYVRNRCAGGAGEGDRALGTEAMVLKKQLGENAPAYIIAHNGVVFVTGESLPNHHSSHSSLTVILSK